MIDTTPVDHTLPNGALMGEYPRYPRYKGVTQRAIAGWRWHVKCDLMPVKELARHLNVHYATACQRLASGEIPLTTTQIDRFTFVPVADAVVYLDSLGIDLADVADAA